MTPEFWTAPGWRALETALADAFPDDPQAIFRTPESIPWESAPLPAIFIHRLADCWHYTSFGLSELFAKKSSDPRRSGWGIELTFRLALGADRDAPPTFPIQLLQNLARSVWQRRAVFLPRHHVALGDPLIEGSKLDSLLFVADPSLPPLETTFGGVIPTQVVGITHDEEDLIAEWSAERFTAYLAQRSPTFVTDPARTSLLDDPNLGHELRAAADREGSSTDGIVPDRLHVREAAGHVTLEVGPADACRENLPRFLRGRTRHGRPFRYHTADIEVEVRPGDASRVFREGDAWVVVLDESSWVRLARALDGTTTTIPVFPGLDLELVP